MSGSAQGRLTLLLACYAMFGISLFASVIIMTQVWSRLVTHKPGAAVMVPTLWIMLGPLGQSITAAGNLGTQAAQVLPEPYAAGAAVFALLYGVPTWGFAMMWLALAAAITMRTARRGLAVRADLVELHLPGRDVRHRHDRAGRPQSRGRTARAPRSSSSRCCWSPGWWSAARTVSGAASGRLFAPVAAISRALST